MNSLYPWVALAICIFVPLALLWVVSVLQNAKKKPDHDNRTTE